MYTDGQVITIGNERSRCPDVFFKSSLISKESSVVHELLATDDSIAEWDGDTT